MTESPKEATVPAFIETLTGAEGEPKWRKILNYGCVVYFLALPALAIVLGFGNFDFGPPGVPAFLREFHFTVSALVVSLAGLNSFDRYKAHSNGSKLKK